MSAISRKPRLGAVARAVWMKTIVMLRRYTFNTISQVVSIYFLFLVVFFGAQGISGAVGGSPVALGDTLDATIVGFFLWFLALATNSDLSWGIMSEARLGTLEQMMMTPVGFRWVSFFQVIANTIASLLMSGVILAAMLLTSGRQLQIDFATVVPLLLLVLVTSTGIGFVLAGLALIYKRIEALFQMMQFIFIALIGAPALIDSVPVLAALPLSLPSLLLNRAMTEGLPLGELGADKLLLAALSAGVYFTVGLLVFGRMERKARDSGSLAQY